MTLRIRVATIMVVSLLAAPGLASAVCFSVTGLPEAAGLDLSPLAPSLRGHAPIVGEAHGVCGLGEPPALVEGAATIEPGGSARLALKLIAARPGCSGGTAEFVLPPPFNVGTGQVRLPEGSVSNARLAVDASGDACRVQSPRPAACVGNATTLCLLQNRFRLTATAAGPSGPLAGQTAKMTSESGLVSFDTSNVEVVLKVLDGRPVNGSYWFGTVPLLGFGATTNIQFTVTVTDTQTGRVKTYINPQGRLAIPATDTNAFPEE